MESSRRNEGEYSQERGNEGMGFELNSERIILRITLFPAASCGELQWVTSFRPICHLCLIITSVPS